MSSNDHSLWERIKKTITPIDREDVLFSDYIDAPIKPKKDKLTPSTVTSSSPYQKEAVVQKSSSLTSINRQTWRKIDKGQLKTDGKLDLHGLTVAQAHTAFNQYIKDAVHTGKKCVIVVTGKGNKEKGTGVIRRELPHWVENPAIAQYIHQISEPSRNQGRYAIILRQKNKIR